MRAILDPLGKQFSILVLWNSSSESVRNKILKLSGGLWHSWSEFNYRQDGILTCFPVLILWTLCGKPMRQRHKALFLQLEFYPKQQAWHILTCCNDWIFLRFFLWTIAFSEFFLLEIYKNLGFLLSSITFTVNTHAVKHFYKYICLFEILYSFKSGQGFLYSNLI